jgi:hypothetical protein
VLPITTISAPHGNNCADDFNEIENFFKLWISLDCESYTLSNY